MSLMIGMLLHSLCNIGKQNKNCYFFYFPTHFLSPGQISGHPQLMLPRTKDRYMCLGLLIPFFHVAKHVAKDVLPGFSLVFLDQFGHLAHVKCRACPVLIFSYVHSNLNSKMYKYVKNLCFLFPLGELIAPLLAIVKCSVSSHKTFNQGYIQKLLFLLIHLRKTADG